MPLYGYECPETGLRLEMCRRVEDRNKPIVLQRTKTVPDRVAVVGIGPTESQTFNEQMCKSYHRKEEREGTRFRSGFSKKQIKQAWL